MGVSWAMRDCQGIGWDGILVFSSQGSGLYVLEGKGLSLLVGEHPFGPRG